MIQEKSFSVQIKNIFITHIIYLFIFYSKYYSCNTIWRESSYLLLFSNKCMFICKRFLSSESFFPSYSHTSCLFSVFYILVVAIWKNRSYYTKSFYLFLFFPHLFFASYCHLYLYLPEWCISVFFHKWIELSWNWLICAVGYLLYLSGIF